MDINKEYAAHQRALMRADRAICQNDRLAYLDRASSIALRINAFQRKLGAEAASTWA